MIKVDNSFHQSGCIMDGKGNRVFLKEKNGKTCIEMIFNGGKVEIRNQAKHTITVDFNQICEIFAIQISPAVSWE